MTRHAFTLLEVLVGACLLSVCVFIFVQLFFMASSYYNFGIFKLSQHSQLRNALDWLRIDIREAGSDITLSDNNQTLTFRKFAVRADGQPAYDGAGMPEPGELCEYKFSRPAGASHGTLYRNKHAILSEISGVAFALLCETVNDAQLLRVVVNIEKQQQNGENRKISLHLSPRHLASWARDPYWVSTESDQRFKYLLKSVP
ncbi:MAG TPA: hypothetical protein PLM07_00460 [Candidatus Rifleibacterium sp.]|nr:hypothetical protein [Candidatus Rifleibacterium sp.]HPT44351.1 hypothetical protein [Candidatus Rifleibacterium sp.]